MRYLIWAVAIVTYSLLLVGSGGETPEVRAKKLAELKAGTPHTVDSAELAALFNMGSKGTDLQRDAKEKELKGKILSWAGLKVYEVSKSGESCYKIQTSSSDAYPGTFIKACESDDPSIATLAPNLKTGDLIKVKGFFTGTTMRNFDFEPAVVGQ